MIGPPDPELDNAEEGTLHWMPNAEGTLAQAQSGSHCVKQLSRSVAISHSLFSTDPIELSDMLSKKTRHAFRALFALANHGSSAPMMIADIAEQASVPRKFLEQILLDLKRTGIVTSYRGKYGGYSLGRAPENITFAEVIRTIDGPLALTPCVSATAYRRCSDCLDEKGCAIRKVLLAVRNATAAILEDHSLADAYALKPAKRRKSG